VETKSVENEGAAGIVCSMWYVHLTQFSIAFRNIVQGHATLNNVQRYVALNGDYRGPLCFTGNRSNVKAAAIT
jgi:hypothetical protein